MSYEHLPREDLLTALDVLEKESKIQKAKLATAVLLMERTEVERDDARADVFLCCQKIGRVRALASAWDGDTTRLRRVEAASRVYRALDEEPGALEALDADQGEGEGA